MEIKKQYSEILKVYDQWKPAHREISELVAPDRGIYDTDNVTQGKKFNHTKLIDSHAVWCNGVLGAGMMSGLTSPSRPWFKVGHSEYKSREAKQYFEDCQKILFRLMSQSNIYDSFSNTFEELGGFGTGAYAILEDDDKVFRTTHFTSGEYQIACGIDGRANHFQYVNSYPVGELVKKYGIDNVSEQTRKLFESKRYYDMVKVYYTVGPNWKRNPLRADNKNFEHIAHYWQDGMDSDQFLKVSGFQEFPIIAPRWKVTNKADSYGRGPGWFALGDTKMLQTLQFEKFKAIDKENDPPVVLGADVQQHSTMPGGIIRAGMGGIDSVKAAYQIDSRLQAKEYSIEKTQGSIGKSFYVDMFLMLQGDTKTGRTAREIVERHEEKLLVLGPTLQRLDNEMLDPTIDRIFAMAQRAGVLPEPPEELVGVNLNVEYISTLAQAQKMIGITAISQFAGFVGEISQIKPEAVKKIDTFGMIDEYAEAIGISPRIIRMTEEVQQEIKQEQQMQQQMQMAQMATQAAGNMDINPASNPVLDQMLGM